MFVLVSLMLVLGGATAAYAVDALPFTDIKGHWAEQEIVDVAARGIIAGHADGTFGPEEFVTRAQLATVIDRLNTEASAPVEARRGCPDCHAGPYSLKNEALNNGAAPHAVLSDDAGVTTCLGCHAPGTGAQEGKGNAAPISLRDIVHPVHMGSKIFAKEFLGDCYSCHNVSGDGTFEVISQTGAGGHPLALSGGHAGVACTSCHVAGTGAPIIPGTNLPRPASSTCAGCHGDQHNGLTTCANCHSVRGWTPANFTHTQVGEHVPSGDRPLACVACHPDGYATNSCSSCHAPSDHPLALTGGHAGVACTSCHVAGTGAPIIPGTNLPRPASSTCAGCHGDQHNGLTTCANCHSVRGWTPANFTHTQVGEHVPSGDRPLACVACHPDGYATNSCSSCHAPSDHPLALTGGHAGVACTSCHVAGTGAPIIPGTNLPRPASSTCAGCHGDQHNGLTTCANCHSVRGWTPANFTHPQVGEHLPKGDEPLTCVKCHPDGFGSNSCTPCHSGTPDDD